MSRTVLVDATDASDDRSKVETAEMSTDTDRRHVGAAQRGAGRRPGQ